MQAQLRNFYGDFGKRLAFIREKQGVTLSELAEGKPTTAKSWEAGSRPGPDRWEAIAKKLGLSVSLIFLGEPKTREDFDFVAKFATDIGPPPGAPTLHYQEPRPLQVEEDRAPYGTPEMLKRELREAIEELIIAAKDDPTRLGWAIEQAREHLSIPRNWRTNEELNQRARELLRQSREAEGRAPLHSSPPPSHKRESA